MIYGGLLVIVSYATSIGPTPSNEGSFLLLDGTNFLLLDGTDLLLL